MGRERDLTVTVSFDIDVRLTLPQDEVTGYFIEPATVDALRESERATWAALREWRRVNCHNGNRPHSRSRAVYNRDGWTCQLCLGPVDKRLRMGHPHCATIDHIIPQAHGGTNVFDNLQLAHAICNHVRGDIPMAYINHNHDLFADVRDEAMRWMKARERFRTAERALVKAQGRWERRCKRARSVRPASGLHPAYLSWRVFRRPAMATA
jgi:hypothetical protein